MSINLIKLGSSLVEEVSRPAAERLVHGDPVHRVANVYADPSQQFFVGRWSATQGKWRVRYTEHELCVMTGGRVLIANDAGEVHTFVAGDAFVIPAGFCGTWEVLEDCSKIYAIFEART